MANRPVRVVVSVLRGRLRGLGSGQVAVSVFWLRRCAVAARSVGCRCGRAGALVRRLRVVVVGCTMRVVVSSLIFVFFVSVRNVVNRRRCSRSAGTSVRVVGRCRLVLLIWVLDSANTGVGANCSLLI